MARLRASQAAVPAGTGDARADRQEPTAPRFPRRGPMVPSAGESFPEGSVLPPDVFVARRPGTARAPAAPLLQLAPCPCLSPAGLVNERVEHVEEESHDCGRGGQDEVSDAAFVRVLGGARTPLLATGPPGVSCRPLGSLELQLLFFSLQFLPDQRSLRCGNLRQHLQNTTGNTPRHPPGQAAACEPSPVPHQPPPPHAARSRPPLQLLGAAGTRGAAGGCRAASSQGCREPAAGSQWSRSSAIGGSRQARGRAAANRRLTVVIPRGLFRWRPMGA